MEGSTVGLHDVPLAGLVKSLFEQKGIPCYLRGYYHRALLYFFGPYIEISVLVPEDRVVDATEVIENYFNPKILTIRPARDFGYTEGASNEENEYKRI